MKHKSTTNFLCSGYSYADDRNGACSRSLPFENSTERDSVSSQRAGASADQLGKSLHERSCLNWQFGNWQLLTLLDPDIIQQESSRSVLSLLAAAGHLQIGQYVEAKQLLRLAKEWGVDDRLVIEILISGIHNSIARAALVARRQEKAAEHFESATCLRMLSDDVTALTWIRWKTQLCQLLEDREHSNPMSGGGPENYDFLASAISNEKLETVKGVAEQGFSSKKYWEGRYRGGAGSGYGSYGRLAEFKSEIINRFVREESIKDLIEFGCGDGNQLSMLRVERYIGVDVSQVVIDRCKDRFREEPAKAFFTVEEFVASPIKAELTLSLDVIFHLVEDDVFENYMRRLFSASGKFCIIYSSDDEEMVDPAEHVRHRKFTSWVSENIKGWRLSKKVFNRYPHDGSVNPRDYSFSDFFFYERTL